jgi:hypothetical protein
MAIPTNQNIFGLLGQSNMCGYGAYPSLIPSYSNIWMLGNDNVWKIAKEPVDDATGQVDIVSRDVLAKYGCSARFASSLSTLKGGAIYLVGLVPCAKGGSTMSQWERGADHQDRTTLYGSAVYRMLQSEAKGTLKGILFYQGEGDSSRELTSHSWADNFATLVENLREDLGYPNLPVVYAQLDKVYYTGTVPYFSLTQSKQNEVYITGSVSYSNMVYTQDLPLDVDSGAHLSADSYDILGDRFATAMNALL